MTLNPQQIERYSRQIVLPEVGARGQQRLLAATVALAGASALAAHAGRYLAGAGVGHLLLVEPGDARIAAELATLNPEIALSTVPGAPMADAIVAADLAAPARDALARQARASTVPLIGVGMGGAGGWLHVAHGPQGCISCAASGAAGEPAAALAAPAAGVLGALAALSTLRLLLGLNTPETTCWWQFDAATATLERRPLSRAANCHSCGG
jgi:molybdopterin/thiamine biosynthesis adenylyltransferase